MNLRAKSAAATLVPMWQSEDGASRFYRAPQAELLASLPDESVDCIWTDPPYLLSNDGSTCVAGRWQKVNKGQWDRSQGIVVDHQFNLAWLRECQRVLTPAGSIWVSGTHHVYLSVGMAMMELGFRILNDIVWEKPNPPPNLGCRCFTHSTEILLWATKATKKSRHRHTFNYATMKAQNGDRQMKNVWRMAAPTVAEKRAGKHPTQKPVALVERCLAASTLPGDLVVDPFAGAATTGLAALRLKRRFIGCEVDANYAELGRQRLREARDDSAATTP